MTELLVQNRVQEFERWKAIFDEQRDVAREAGLHLKEVWRDVEDPQTVFVLFEVESIQRAKAFMAEPASAEVGISAGVIDGNAWFVVPGTTD